MSTTINQIQGQFTGFYFLISFLNLKREFIIFMALSICLHILDPKYRADDTHFESGVEEGARRVKKMSATMVGRLRKFRNLQALKQP